MTEPTPDPMPAALRRLVNASIAVAVGHVHELGVEDPAPEWRELNDAVCEARRVLGGP